MESTPSKERDRTALLALFKATGGIEWTNRWDINKGISNWHGVVLNSESRVVKLYLEDNNLRGFIPKEIGDLSELQELNLDYNKLAGPMPKELGNLNALQKLYIQGNQLTGSIPEELGKLRALQRLGLSGNQLTGSIPKALGNLSALEKLYINRNKLNGSIPKELGCLRSLQEINLSINKLTGSIPREMGNLVNIGKIGLHDNQLTGMIPMELSKLKFLKKLETRSNKLKISFRVTYPGDPFYEWMHRPGFNHELKSLALTSRNLQGARRPPRPTPYAEEKAPATPVDAPDTAIQRIKLHHADEKGKGNQSPATPVDEGGTGTGGPPTETGGGAKDEGGNRSLYFSGIPEAPLTEFAEDRLHFDKYAEVIAKELKNPGVWPVAIGIYATWGSGKSSLLHLILKLLEKPTSEQKRNKLSTRCLKSARAWCKWRRSAVKEPESNDASSPTAGEGETGGQGPPAADVEAQQGDNAQEEQIDNEKEQQSDNEQGQQSDNKQGQQIDHIQAQQSDNERIECVVAKFDAWLFSDSEALWAILISHIFDQVESHACFGQRAVRAGLVTAAVKSASLTSWIFGIAVVGAIAGAAVVILELANQVSAINNIVQEIAIWIGVAAVPISIVKCLIKAFPMLFTGPGKAILKTATSRAQSVGSGHLGFMEEVQTEMKDLLELVKDGCHTKGHKKHVLVVSIDNLDRCPHRQVVKVMEAVHLMLEQEKTNVIILLALDPRVIIAAIEAEMGEHIREEVSGAEYLDKVVHWPFCIPVSTKTERQDVVNQCSDGKQKPEDLAGGRCGAQDAPVIPVSAEGETEEFEQLTGMIATTPRKIKRVWNIYNIQRSVALAKSPDDLARFAHGGMRKLLRWTILAEFWQFRTACLLGCINIELKRTEANGRNKTVETIYGDVVARYITEMTGVGDTHSSAEIARLLRMDESEEVFLQLLGSSPPILLDDFREGRLEISSLSFNLNPAVVAKVTAWLRLRFRTEYYARRP